MTEKPTSVERLLLDHVERLERNRAGRRAVVMRLSRLRPTNRGARQLRIAANTFETLVKQFDGQMFVLQQGDIIFICKYENAAATDAAVTKVRYLFDDDPLTAQLFTDSDGFATWFDLDTDFTRFRALVDETVREDEAGRKRLEAIAPAAMAERQPMDPSSLSELINAIATADVSNLLRRQAICAIIPGEVPQPLLRELYVSIADLRDTIMPRRDLYSDRWLFQYLTQTLDKRVLALLRKADDVELSHSYSLNLNVSTLLSPEFLAFDANLKSGARGSIVIEIEKIEIFADLGAYLFARDFARERGYRFCLDSVTRLILPFIARQRLGVDLVKLFWNPDMAEGKSSDRDGEFLAALERVGTERVILARCDTEQAIEFGHRVGIKLFQGRIVDTLLHAGRSPAITRKRLAAAAATR